MPYRVYKRKGSPCYQAYISVKVDGVARHVRISTHTPVRDKAITIARATEADLLVVTGHNDITIGQAFGEFYTRESHRYSIPRNIYYTLNSISGFMGESKSFSQITAADINDYIYHMQNTGRAAGTINRHLVILSAVITTCRKKWKFNAPDVHPLEFKCREPDGRIGLVDDNERLLIMCHAAPHLRLAMEIAYYTGLRRGNILTLRWDEIDFKRRAITKYIKDSNLAGGRAHTAYFPKRLADILQNTPRDCDYVISFNGHPVRELKTAWAAAMRRAGIPAGKYRFHDVRHSSATAIVRKTKSLYAAQVHLGHKTPKMSQRYAKFLEEDRQRIASEVFDT